MGAFLAAQQVQLWTIATVLCGAIFTRLLRLRPRLFYSIGHASTLLADDARIDDKGEPVPNLAVVRTASITVGNSGLQAAKAVEITFNWRPQIFNVLPPRAFEEATSAFNRFSLKFDSMAPGEQLDINIMSVNNDLPVLTAVRSEDCVAKVISLVPQRVYPGWVRGGAALLLLLGAASFLNGNIYLLRIVRPTGNDHGGDILRHDLRFPRLFEARYPPRKSRYPYSVGSRPP